MNLQEREKAFEAEYFHRQDQAFRDHAADMKTHLQDLLKNQDDREALIAQVIGVYVTERTPEDFLQKALPILEVAGVDRESFLQKIAVHTP